MGTGSPRITNILFSEHLAIKSKVRNKVKYTPCCRLRESKLVVFSELSSSGLLRSEWLFLRRFGTTYQSRPHGSRTQNKACSPNTTETFQCPHSSLYTLRIGERFSFGFLNPEDGTDRLPRNVCKK
jgi:hypothetical protein